MIKITLHPNISWLELNATKTKVRCPICGTFNWMAEDCKGCDQEFRMYSENQIDWFYKSRKDHIDGFSMCVRYNPSLDTLILYNYWTNPRDYITVDGVSPISFKHLQNKAELIMAFQ